MLIKNLISNIYAAPAVKGLSTGSDHVLTSRTTTITSCTLTYNALVTFIYTILIMASIIKQIYKTC